MTFAANTDFNFQSKDSGVAYQGILGLIFSSARFGELGLEYRYLNGPEMQNNHTLDLNMKFFF